MAMRSNDISIPFIQPIYRTLPYPDRTPRPSPLLRRKNQLLKRSMDLGLSTFLILGVLSWLLPVLAILIKADSSGPLFFVQKRRKRGLGVFGCIKFRTMRVNSEADTRLATDNDERITHIGRWLRRTHLDELPQLFNVWRGDMSLVGPRPYMLQEDRKYAKTLERYEERSRVKPGITGLAQASGYFGSTGKQTEMEKRLSLDIRYVLDWTPALDLQVLIRTFRFFGPQIASATPEASAHPVTSIIPGPHTSRKGNGPKKTTILILTPGFPSSEDESVCLPAQQVMVRALKKKSPFVQFIILTFEYPFTKTPYRWGGNLVYPFDNRNRGKGQRILMWMRVWKKMESLRRENDVIGVFSFWHGECALLGTYFARLHGLKHYNWVLGQDARGDNKYVALTRPRAEELLAISESVADTFFIHHSVRPRHILPNGIDPSLFPYRGISKDIDILGAGTLKPLKQYSIWMDITCSLAEKRPGLKAVLCGKGPEAGQLKRTLRERGLADNLSLAGELPHRDLLGMMQRSKIFLHPSSYEGFSTACLEALYAGAHVISFTYPTHAPIEHWHKVFSPEEMEAKALEILSDPRTDYTPVYPFSMEDNAAAVMQLFCGQEGARRSQ